MNDPAAAVLPIDAGAALPPEAGGKALGLRALAGAGLPVPAAWVVLPGPANGAVGALAATLSARGIRTVAVRSSAADEDGAVHSFAGLHESALAVPVAALGAAVVRVAASVHAERALAYRRQLGLPAPAGPCAVVVQDMVDAEWSGVAFGRGAGVLVEAVEGLGETAVAGDATPETIELEHEGPSWRVTRRWPRRQRFALRPTANGTARVGLTGPCGELPAALALAIAAGVATLERTQGVRLDVEWAARDGAVAFLQARPQTRPLAEPGLPPGETWTRANVRELTPEIGSALCASVVVSPFDTYFRAFFRSIGVPLPPDVPMLALVAGRAVANERMFCAVGDLVGLPRSWMQVMQGGSGAAANALEPLDLRKLVRHLDVVLRLRLFAAGAERKARRFMATLPARRAARAAAPSSSLSDAALLARIRRITGEEVVEILEHVNRVANAHANAVSAAAMALRGHPAPAALVARLVDPEVVSVSTRQLEEQVELARTLRRSAEARRFLEEVAPEHASATSWRRALPAEAWAQVERWLAAHGHRGTYESDLAQPRIAEDLRLLASALRPLVLGADEPGVEVRRVRRRVEWEEAWRAVCAGSGWLARARLRAAVRDVGRLTLLREELRSEWMRDWGLARRDLLEVGRRLAGRGGLDAEEEVFHLSLIEVERALSEPGFETRSAVARQRARIAAWRRVEVPNRFTSEEARDLPRRVAPELDDAVRLQGTAVSPGVVEGIACVLRSPFDEVRMRPGGILVAPATDPGWTPLFARAAGVVVELGGVMSHSATIAREYGLPCVSNVPGAVERLRDGDLLGVDGTLGVVEVLRRAPE